nr:MAG TPA: hypothetical protein [Caudoviricetes sp.]
MNYLSKFFNMVFIFQFKARFVITNTSIGIKET